MFEMMSTGKMISFYLEDNGYVVADLARESGLSEKSIYRLLNDEIKLTLDVAFALNKLIKELDPKFLMSYDAQYQTEKAIFEKQNDVKNISSIIANYKLKKLFKGYDGSNMELFEIGEEIFGSNNIKHGRIASDEITCFQFKKAKNSLSDVSKLWVITAYKECLKRYSLANKQLRVFNKTVFDDKIKMLKRLSKTKSIQQTLFNMDKFCELCGINFYYRPSIANAKVRAVSVKNNDGHVFIFVSDLFKCVENLWLAFVHECIHIGEDDLDKLDLNEEDIKENENYVDNKAIEFFIPSNELKNDDYSYENLLRLSTKYLVSEGIVAEIFRFKSKNYKDYQINTLINHYDENEVPFESPFIQ